MCSGVGKSGSPAPKPMTSSPAACSALALASTASVADSAMAARRAGNSVHGCHADTVTSVAPPPSWRSRPNCCPPTAASAADRRRCAPSRSTPSSPRRPSIIGTSHRQAPVKRPRRRRSAAASPSCSRLPDGWEVVLGNGGTTVFWDVATFGLVERRSQHLVFGEFSAKFADACAAAPHLADPVGDLGASPATIPTPSPTPTSTSTPSPTTRRRPAWRCSCAGPTAPATTSSSLVDATSAAGGLPWDPAEVDVYYFAPQKCFAADGGLWIAACSPAAIERIDRIAASGRWRPASLDLAIALDNSRLDQTYNTPAVDHARAVRQPARVDARARRAGGVRQALAGRRPSTSTAGPRRRRGRRRSSPTRPSARPSSARSTSTTRIDVAKLNAALRANGIVDTDGYRKLGRNQIRIGMFPAIETSDVVALTACIDHLVEHHAEALRAAEPTAPVRRSALAPRRSTTLAPLDRPGAARRPRRLVRRRRCGDVGAAPHRRRVEQRRRRRDRPGSVLRLHRRPTDRSRTSTASGGITWPANVFRAVRTPAATATSSASTGSSRTSPGRRYVACVVDGDRAARRRPRRHARRRRRHDAAHPAAGGGRQHHRPRPGGGVRPRRPDATRDRPA